MGQFDKNKKLSFVLNDINSIRSVLEEYQELLKSDQVVEDEVYQIEFVKKVDDTIEPLQKTDGCFEQLDKLSVWGESHLNFDTMDFNGNASETILFSHALKFPELKEDVISTAKEIVSYSRRHNDTCNMWVDDLCVFGIEALYLLALNIPKYAYLIGAYLIPYWDSEHADYALIYTYEITSRFGFDDNMLKMFCYCDNVEARTIMLGGEFYGEQTELDLVEYFEQNPDRYERFKEIMIDRFKEQQFIQYSEFEYTSKPIHSFYESIMASSDSIVEEYDVCEDSSDALEEVFMNSTFNNEATLLHQKIEEIIGKPLTSI